VYAGQGSLAADGAKPSATSAASVLRAHAGLPASASSLLPSNGLVAGAWIAIVQ
jgi:hypothetical protein